MSASPRPVEARSGDVVAWWDGGTLGLAVFVGEEKRRAALLPAEGREARVTWSRIAFVVRASDGDSASVEASRARAAECEREVASEAARVDVPTVWELVVDEPESPQLEALAELALARADGVAKAAIVRAFVSEGVRFVRRGPGFEARNRDAVARLDVEREATRRRELERSEARRALERVVASSDAEVPPRDANPTWDAWLGALRELAVEGDEASEASRATASEPVEIAKSPGEAPHETAFRVMRRVGTFDSDDINLEIIRYGLRTAFPEDVLERAGAVANREFRGAEREDLTDLDVLTIDSPSTREIDDGLSIVRAGGGAYELGVHIADPTPFVEAGDVVDVEASSRAVTHYFPEGALPMLPSRLGADAASLVRGEERPALSFLATVRPDGTVDGARLTRSVVRVRSRLDYATVEEALETGGDAHRAPLEAWSEVAGWLEAARLRSGAVLLRTPDVDLRVDGDRRISIERLDAGSRARRVVTEAMVLAGRLAADFCVAHDLPVVYRRQKVSLDAGVGAGGPIDDPVEIRRVRRGLRPAESSLSPAPHAALGLDAYVQATSPLRRFSDLVAHRQITAVLEHREPPYDAETLSGISARVDRAERDARRAERRRVEYWKLEYLRTHVGDRFEAVVLEIDPRPVAWVPTVDFETVVPAIAGASVGERVTLEVIDARPRARKVRLMPV